MNSEQNQAPKHGFIQIIGRIIISFALSTRCGPSLSTCSPSLLCRKFYLRAKWGACIYSDFPVASSSLFYRCSCTSAHFWFAFGALCDEFKSPFYEDKVYKPASI